MKVKELMEKLSQLSEDLDVYVFVTTSLQEVDCREMDELIVGVRTDHNYDFISDEKGDCVFLG